MYDNVFFLIPTHIKVHHESHQTLASGTALTHWTESSVHDNRAHYGIYTVQFNSFTLDRVMNLNNTCYLFGNKFLLSFCPALICSSNKSFGLKATVTAQVVLIKCFVVWSMGFNYHQAFRLYQLLKGHNIRRMLRLATPERMQALAEPRRAQFPFRSHSTCRPAALLAFIMCVEGQLNPAHGSCCQPCAERGSFYFI